MVVYLKNIKEVIGKKMLFISCCVSASVIILIAVMISIEAVPIFLREGLKVFLDVWDPNKGKYGMAPFILGSIYVVIIALIMAVPIGVLSALFVVEFASKKVREFLEALFQVNFSIPSIIYGLWALLFIVPILRGTVQPFLKTYFGFIPLFRGEPRGFGIMAAGTILAIMIVPLIAAISIEVMKLVPEELKMSAYALGASRSEVAFRVTLKVAFPGVAAAVLLSIGRAIGETMAVLWVTGNVAIIPKSLFDPCYLMTSVLVNEFGASVRDPYHISALFAVAFMLLITSIIFVAVSRYMIYSIEKKWGRR